MNNLICHFKLAARPCRIEVGEVDFCGSAVPHPESEESTQNWSRQPFFWLMAPPWSEPSATRGGAVPRANHVVGSVWLGWIGFAFSETEGGGRGGEGVRVIMQNFACRFVSCWAVAARRPAVAVLQSLPLCPVSIRIQT